MKNNKKIASGITLIIAALLILLGNDNTSYSSIIKDVLNDVSNNSKLEVGSDLEIYFMDVGQADSILIRNDDENMLIDAGNNSDGDKLVKYFKDMGIHSFSYLVGTHAHEDHIGGMDDIIDNFDVGKFYMPNVIATTRTFEDVLDSLDRKNYKFSTPNIGDKFRMGDCNFEVIHVGDNKRDLNSTSIILHMTYGNTSYLFTGDAEDNVEKTILNKNIKSDVLKVGHHGSDTSTTREFLDKVDPRYAIISAGVNNIYNHPAKTTLSKLEDKNILVYRTDIDGTIHLKSDGKTIKVDTIRTDTNG